MGHVFRLQNCLKMEMLTLKTFSGSEHIVPNQWVWVFLEGFIWIREVGIGRR